MFKTVTKSLHRREILQYLQYRFYTSNIKHVDIKKSVFISQSKDVYNNLALEDWLFKNYDYTHNHVLMLWQNDPCVVIGRHQNPWDEVNVGNLAKEDIALARRNSGGGTVYHDSGNLNLTFFTSRKHYDRKYNLELIKSAVLKEFHLELSITPKFDVKYGEKKVSGTASKLGRNNAYHHCTLLVQSDKEKLNQVLNKRQTFINSNATKSIPASVTNLNEENPKINMESLISAIGWEYLRTNPVVLKDEGTEHLKEQKGFQLINPNEEWFPGLIEIHNGLKSWDWCYGKTPKFTVTRSFPIPAELLSQTQPNSQELNIKISVVNGQIEEVFINIPPGLILNSPEGYVKVMTNLEGLKFTEETINNLKFSLKDLNIISHDKQFVAECFQKVVTHV